MFSEREKKGKQRGVGLLGPLSILSVGKNFLEKDCEGLGKKEGIQIGIITKRRSHGEKGESGSVLNQIGGIAS